MGRNNSSQRKHLGLNLRYPAYPVALSGSDRGAGHCSWRGLNGVMDTSHRQPGGGESRSHLINDDCECEYSCLLSTVYFTSDCLLTTKEAIISRLGVHWV
jgi:hypothetical protein